MRGKDFPVETIVVDDGSTDNTVEIASGQAGIRVLRNERNRGKGFSVRHGVLEARGELILFTDADLSAPIEEADKLLAAMESSHADAVVGSRALQRELIGVHQSPFREWGGRFFNLLVRIFTGLRIHDTQCGFKLFRRETTRRAFELQRVERFGFDPEILFLSRAPGGQGGGGPGALESQPCHQGALSAGFPAHDPGPGGSSLAGFDGPVRKGRRQWAVGSSGLGQSPGRCVQNHDTFDCQGRCCSAALWLNIRQALLTFRSCCFHPISATFFA